ncbi:MAG: hypothetical protein GF375_03450, partial [Candidatus Omnitrophica bacterium]|nr:hypothetical protein [Candidatus Omnitrophota bacterium]MBD3269130.1 hypothetical protein [Candidatus Omnitrophota bacterium]
MRSFRFKISLKKLFVVAVIEVILFALGVRMGIDTFFFFFLVIALLFILDLLLVLANMAVSKKIQLSRECPTKLTEDQALKVELTFRNDGITPIFNAVIHDYLGCADEKKRSFFLEWISPRQVFKLEYGCICKLRGRYIVGPIRIELMGLLGFFSGEGSMGMSEEVYVYPKTFSIRKTPMLVKGRVPWFGVDTVPKSGDEDEFFGVREYHPGDPIKKI